MITLFKQSPNFPCVGRNECSFVFTSKSPNLPLARRAVTKLWAVRYQGFDWQRIITHSFDWTAWPDIFSIIWSLALLILWKPDGSSTTFQTTTTINQNFQYKPEYKMRINWENACKETKSLWQLWMLWDVQELFTNNERWKEKDLILFLKRKKNLRGF